MPTFTQVAAAMSLAAALAACQPTTEAAAPATSDDGFTRISTRAELAPILDRRLNFQGADFVVINSDGTFAGEFGGANTTGTWQMQDGYWCRTLIEASAQALERAREDCQLFERRGDTLRGTRARGEGSQFEYTIA